MFRFFQDLFKPSDHKSTIIIIGLGPTGLATALETVKLNEGKHRIVLLTDRTAYERKPIYRINDQAYRYLVDLVGRRKMIQLALSGNLYGVNFSDDIYYEERYEELRIDRTEKVLWEALQHYKNQFELITVAKRQDITVHADTREVALADGRRIGFKYLIGADGVRHGIANQLMRQGVDLHYGPSHQRQIHSFHAISCYYLPDQKTMEHYRKALLQSEDDKERLTALLAEMKKLHWTLHSFPEARIFIVENTLYVGAEAPRHQLRSDEAIDQWLRLVLRGSYSDADVDRLQALGVLNEPRKNDTFEIMLEEADRVVVPLPPPDEKPTDDNTSYFIQLGDALRAPHYQTGSGVVLGLLGARAWGSYLRTPQTSADLEIFSDIIIANILANRERVEKFLERRDVRERLAKNDNVHLRLSSAVNFGFDTSVAIQKRLLRMIQDSPFSSERKRAELIEKYDELARQFDEASDYNAAIYCVTQCIEIFKHHHRPTKYLLSLLDDRGCYHYAKGDYAAAAQDFKRVLALFPEWGLANHHLAQAYYALDDIKSAFKYTQKALQGTNHNDNARGVTFEFRSDLFVQRAQFSRALDAINQCIRLLATGDDGVGYFSASLIPRYIKRGNILHALGNDQEARWNFSRAMRIEQGDQKASAGFQAAERLGLFWGRGKRRAHEMTKDKAPMGEEKVIEESHKRVRLSK